IIEWRPARVVFRGAVMSRWSVVVLFLLWLLGAAGALAEENIGAAVQLPYVFHDDMGSNWDVQYDGSIGDGGNDLYDGGGRLFINGSAQYQSPNQQAMFDAAHNELTFPPVAMGGVNVSRRVAVFPSLNTVRFVEVIENGGAAAIKVELRCYFNMGGSVQAAVPLVYER